MIQKIILIAASITLIGSSSQTAYADDMLDKDYIVREIWSDWWHGKGYDWSKIGQLNYNFKDYYDELTDNWNFNDDCDGNWTIITDETTYHFNLQNGKWLMSDDNGNVIDSFMPFSTLTKDTVQKNRNSVMADDGNGTAHRVGENLKIEANATVGVSEEATKPTSAEKSSNGLIYGIGGIILAGIAVLAGFLIKKKRG